MSKCVKNKIIIDKLIKNKIEMILLCLKRIK